MHNFQDLTQRERLLLVLIAMLTIGLGALLFMGKSAPEVAASNSCDVILSEWKTTHAEDAASKQLYTGEIAVVDFKSANHPQLDRLKNGISKAVKEGANFAGHYAVVEWGCGSNCQEHAVVDVQSGKIITFGIPSEAGLHFLPESNTIITNPQPNFPTLADLKDSAFDDKAYWYNLPREYYVLEESENSALVRRICIANAFEGQRL